MIEIDGSQGEGGGQVLRTALTLSLLTGQPFRMVKIRQGRPKPGLLRQHLTAVNAAAALGDAHTTGTDIGSRELMFSPRQLRGGMYEFRIGTAGSATLVLQAVLPALLAAEAPSHLILEGGTHNPGAPTFDYLDQVYLPVLRRMGAEVEAKLKAYGFYPAGGGRIAVQVSPSPLRPLELVERGASRGEELTVLAANLPFAIAADEAAQIAGELGLSDRVRVLRVASTGPGNVARLTMAYDNVVEQVTAFGERTVSREEVARRLVRQAGRGLADDKGDPGGGFCPQHRRRTARQQQAQQPGGKQVSAHAVFSSSSVALPPSTAKEAGARPAR